MKGNEEIRKKFPPEYIDSRKKKKPEFYKFTMGFALSSIEGISDLKTLLIINKTEKPFISSDAPIIINNYYWIKKGSLTGFLSPGLQIICPLTDRLLLILLHQEAYRIESEGDSIVNVTEISDINTFNKLQILNCLQILLLTEQKYVAYVEKLQSEVTKTRKHHTEKLFKKTPEPDGGHSEIVAMMTEGVNFRLHFSFLKMNHDYNKKFKWQCKRLLKTTQILLPYRNKELMERMAHRFNYLNKKDGR